MASPFTQRNRALFVSNTKKLAQLSVYRSPCRRPPQWISINRLIGSPRNVMSPMAGGVSDIMFPRRIIFARTFSEPNKLNGSKYGNGSRAEGLLKIRVYLRAPIIVYGSAQAPPLAESWSLLSKMIIFNPKNGENFEKNAKKEAPQGGFDTKTQSKLHKICLFSIPPFFAHLTTEIDAQVQVVTHSLRRS